MNAGWCGPVPDSFRHNSARDGPAKRPTLAIPFADKEIPMSPTVRQTGVFALFTALLCVSLAQNAVADTWIGSFHHKDPDDGADVYTHYYDKDGDGQPDYMVEYAYLEDMEFVQVKDVGNPDPNDPGSSTRKGDLESGIALAKQTGGGNEWPQKDFAQTPIGQVFSGHGKGPAPSWNPSDEAGGGTPANHFEDKTEQDLFKGFGGSGSGFTFEPNAGSLGEQLKKHGNGGGQGGGDDDGSDDEPPGSPQQGGELGPKPPIVNPPTVKKHAGGLFTRHVSDPDDKQLGGPDTKQVQKSFVLLPPSTKGFNLNGPAGNSSLQGGSFNWGSFGGHPAGAGRPAGAARIAR